MTTFRNPPNIFFKVEDNWHDNYHDGNPKNNTFVTLSIYPHRRVGTEEPHPNGLWHICVWGTDDKGVELDGPEDYIWGKFAEVTVAAATKPLNYQWFLDIDFSPA